VSSRARLLFDCVADQLSVHDVGQAAFQAAHGFVVIFAFGSFPQVVAPAGGVVADLGDGHDVEAEIELAIASAGKPVAHHLAGGHLDGGGRRSRWKAITVWHNGKQEMTGTVRTYRPLIRWSQARALSPIASTPVASMPVTGLGGMA
jgi:hypothetical protein